MSKRSPISLFSSPSAASSTILARITSRYGNVYRRVLASSTLCSLGGQHDDVWAGSGHFSPPWVRPEDGDSGSQMPVFLYVIVFMSTCTSSGSQFQEAERTPRESAASPRLVLRWIDQLIGGPRYSRGWQYLALHGRNLGTLSSARADLLVLTGSRSCITGFQTTLRHSFLQARTRSPARNFGHRFTALGYSRPVTALHHRSTRTLPRPQYRSWATGGGGGSCRCAR